MSETEAIHTTWVDPATLRSTDTAPYGVTRTGFVAKPFARLLAEKLQLARNLLGDDVDLGSASPIRKILELTSLEDARTWAALASMYDDMFAATATARGLSLIGQELGLSRPYEHAAGRVKLKMAGNLPAGFDELEIPRGSRMFTSLGGHHVATKDVVVFDAENNEHEIEVEAFYPGPSHNLDPAATDNDGNTPEKIDQWNRFDDKLQSLVAAEQSAVDDETEFTITIDHTEKLEGGNARWSDARYRSLLLRAPRSIWSVETIETAVQLVPGVRQAQAHDGWGGLDINQSIFGNFNFIDRVFSAERDLASPYYFSVLVAPTAAAIWSGPDGLRTSVLSAIEDLRPIGIFPDVREAAEVSVGVQCKLVVRGYPLPSGSLDTVNQSQSALELKARLRERLRNYIETLPFGEPVRVAQVMRSLTDEPSVADVLELKLARYPATLRSLDFSQTSKSEPEILDCGKNVTLNTDEIAAYHDDDDTLEIV